jgi:hypothetical protein
MPWKGDAPEDVFANVLNDDFVLPDSATASKGALELLYMLLERKPLDRAIPAEIKHHGLFDNP